MKKKSNYFTFKECGFTKLKLIMKLLSLFILVPLLQVSAVGFSQNNKISIDIKSACLPDVLEEIESQSDYRFIYKDDLIDENIQYNINMDRKTIDEILDGLFKNSALTYRLLEDNLVVLANKRLLSQEIVVKGKVTDTNGNPLPGVNVVEKGTTSGAVSNLDGEYSISVGSSDAILSFSFVGFLTEEAEVAGKTTINIIMVEDIQLLDEVVVIGYTSTSRKNLASAISAISDEEITGLSTTDVRQVLQGKMSGVQVINNSGDPGSGVQIVVRGVGSFTSSDPLYVIDGIQGGNINSLQPGDIESITILKDASTTAIYGSAAANGVVLITTKSGKKGDLKVFYNGSVGLSTFTKRYDMLNAAQYIDLISDIQEVNGSELTPTLMTNDVLVDRTDWQDAIFRNTLVTDHNLGFRGGSENINYAFSIGYQNHESYIIDQNFQRVTVGSKLEEKIFNNRISFGQNLRVKYDKIQGSTAHLADALRMPPYKTIYDPTNLGGYSYCDKVTELTDANNPYNQIYNNSGIESRDLSVSLDLTAEVNILEGLKFKTQSRIEGGNYHSYNWISPNRGGTSYKPSAIMEETFSWAYSMILENFFSYDRTFGDHQLSLLAGNTYDPSVISRSVGVSGEGYTSDEIKNVVLASSTSISSASVNSGAKARLSYFGRLGYTLLGRYIFNASVRRDGSSVFGANHRWGTFYGTGAAWTISEEDFMQSISAISNLKLRASYGKTGNDNIEPFLTSQTIWKGENNNVVYSFGDVDGTLSYGSTINNTANPDLRWEETTQYDIGLDVGLLGGHLNFVIDYFHRDNKDLLIQTQIPNSTGLGNPSENATQWVNAASMKNTGFEFEASYADNSKDFKWGITVNTTYSTNEVYALGTAGDVPIFSGELSVTTDYITCTDIGQPLGSFYGYVVDHVAVDQAEVDALNAQAASASGGAITEYKTNLAPGDFIWKDIDGNGYIDEDDETFLGNPSPTWQFGGLFNASYKNFDFQLQFFGLADVDIVNANYDWLKGMSKPFNASADVLRRWSNEGDVTDMIGVSDHPTANIVMSDWYVEKGDYLKIRNITLGYTLPKNLIKGVINQLRVYVSAQNVLTLTKYSGYDPEISAQDPDDEKSFIFSRGIDLFQHPNPTMYRFGLQLNF